MATPPPSRDATSRAGSLRAALANIGWLLGGRGVAAALSLVYIALIARVLGPAGFGQFALIVGIAQALTALVGFQTWQIIVRFGMGHLHEGRSDALARLIKACLALDIGGAAVGALLALAAVWLLGPLFGWPPEVRSHAFLFCFVSLVAVRSTPIGILRLHDRFGEAAYADTAVPIVRLTGALIVWQAGFGVEGFLAAWAVAEICSAIAFWWLAAGAMRGLPWKGSHLRLPALRQENPGLYAFAGITNAGQTFALASRQLPLLLVGLYVTPAAAGGFRLAHQLGQALAKVAQLAARALFPELMRARTVGGDPDHFTKLLKQSVQLAAIAGAAILFVLLIAGKTLLVLVAGEAYLPAYPLLLLLGAAAAVELIGVGFEPALIASGRAWLSFRIQLLVALTIVVALFAWIQSRGTIGAGAAVLAGALLSFVLMGIATYRTIRRNDPPVTPADAALLQGAEKDVDKPEAL